MKRILKAIFPPVILKGAFLIYNVIKAKAWDPIFFPREAIPLSRYRDYKTINPFLEMNIDLTVFSPEIQGKFRRWTDPAWSQDQYLLCYDKPGFIEAHTGWAISEDRRLIYPSLGFSSAPYVPKPAFSETYLNRRKVTDVKRIISLRDTGEENYFHFFNDVLAKLFYLKESGILLEDYEIVISEKLYRKDYFQFFLKSSLLKTLRWRIQEDEWIHFEQAVFCKPLTHTKRYFQEMLNLTGFKTRTGNDRRIFLTRSKKTSRYIENIETIEPVLQKYNFEIVDTSAMSIQDQIAMFSTCRYLVAIHGAGITNIVFRNGLPLSLIEIVHPNSYIPFHYIMLARLFNYDFDILSGKKGLDNLTGGFRVDPGGLESKITVMLKGN